MADITLATADDIQFGLDDPNIGFDLGGDGIGSQDFEFDLGINFGDGLAKLRYEVRASVEVGWKGEIRLVTDKKEANVAETIINSLSHHRGKVTIEENGKLWAHARILNRYVVAGQRVCVELFVRNHTSKKVC